MAVAVNLPTTLGGFSFKGIHSSTYGVRETPESRILSPQKRRTLLDIPGRSSAVVVEDGGYSARVEGIKCSYAAQQDVSLQRQVRLIAAWLDGIGELVFDYEPAMRYNAFVSSSPPTVKMLEYATFDVTFTINHPFAYEAAQEIEISVTNAQVIPITIGGTVKTPAYIILKNTGAQSITNIVVSLTSIIDI